MNESIGLVSVPITRVGDVSFKHSVLCSTHPITAIGSSGRQLKSGTDYLSLTDHVIDFDIGVRRRSCDVVVCCCMYVLPSARHCLVSMYMSAIDRF